jgi:hypothetical protein
VTRNPNSNATRASRASDDADRRFERHVARLHRLGARAVCELLLEVGASTKHMTTIEAALARYAALDPDTLRVLRGDRFAPRPEMRVVGGQDHE